MRMSRREIPQVALLQIIHERTTILVKGGDADLSIEHICPLSLLVPMKLTDHARSETHVYASDLDARG